MPSPRGPTRSCKEISVDDLDAHITLSWLGLLEPLAIFAAFLSNTEAGGDLRMNVKLLSENTVMTTGRIIPFWSLVRALNSLQNAMMLTPCAPRAGPTGGAGFAAPAGSWRRM